MKTALAAMPAVLRLVGPAAAVALLVAATNAAPYGGGASTAEEPVEAAVLFPDAPDGVDPVVTGPVSTSFRKTQEAFGCDRAKWPNIPAACYPR